MINIPVIRGTNEDGEPTLSPAAPFPANRLAVVCDGSKYIVYEPGDILPPPETTE